jgi:hypothetical protein
MAESQPIIFEARMPKNCPRCGTPVIRNHPDRPGGITQYCPCCCEHVRMLFGIVPVRLKRCSCGAFTQFNGRPITGPSITTWTCWECKHTKFGEEDLIWLKWLGILGAGQ